MRLINQDFKKGTVKVRITDLDDIWYLNQIIEPGDLVTGKATRKVKIGDSENAASAKKTFTATIEVESVEFGAAGNSLRLNGKIKEGPEDIPHDSYQTISLEENGEATIQKKWQEYQKQKLRESGEKKSQYLICLLDREEALFVITKRSSHEILTKVQGQVAKKSQSVEIKKDFHEELLRLLDEYFLRFHPDNVILASPAFYKEELAKKITSPELKKKIVLATCFDVGESGIYEVLKRPELQNVLKNNRAREEQLLVEELLVGINKNSAVAYGWKEVAKAIETGAVKDLLVTDMLIKQLKEEGKFSELDRLMKTVDASQGKIHLLSSENEGGKKLNGLGGIGALLRYKV